MIHSIFVKATVLFAALIITVVTLISILLTGPYPFFSLPPFVQEEASLVFGADGTVIARLFEENREIVTLQQISPYLVQAVVATEDSRFYTHPGVDFIGVGRAILEDIRQRRLAQGASTITQQLARNLYNLTTARSFLRKAEELRLALLLEKHYSKDEIIELYLNQIYMGHGTFGVQSASRVYFGKSAAELNLAEAAMLAGLIRGPELYSPRNDFTRAKSRQSWTLGRMVSVGYISEEQADVARDMEVTIASRAAVLTGGGYIRDIVTRTLSAVLPDGGSLVSRAGLRIHTSIDPLMQAAAEESLAQLQTTRTDNHGTPQPQGAIVAMDPHTGHIKAWVGGRDTLSPQFNRVTDALRSPGSAFKPFVYITALESGITAAELTRCEPTVFPLITGEEWTPSDFGAKFHDRDLAMREAIVLSCNLVASKTIQQLTPEKVAETARRLGLQTPINPVLSLALGTSETTALNMASAFLPLVNGGRSIHWPTNNVILRVENNRGQVLWQNAPTLISGALDPRVAFIMTDMMRGVLRFPGTGSVGRAIFDRPAAGKTGTSEYNRDAWFVGYSPSLVAAVYVGNDDNLPLPTGGALAVPVWARFMAKAHGNNPIEDFQRPAGIEDATICISSGLLAREECPHELRLNELFLAGTAPTTACTIHEPTPTRPPLPWWNWLFPRSEDNPAPDEPAELSEEIHEPPLENGEDVGELAPDSEDDDVSGP